MASRTTRTIVVTMAIPFFVGGCGTESQQTSAGDAGAERDAPSQSDGESDVDADTPIDAGTPITPELEPITAAQAERLGAYARGLTCANQGTSPRPVAWSMINVACEDRAIALEFALASADPELVGNPPAMVDTDLTAERIVELAAHPSFDVASINAAGPLVTFQSLRDRDGSAIGEDPLQHYWPYHHGVVVNVEGELRVLDLSMGNAPVPIDDWLAGFVDPSVPCYHASDEVHAEVWTYWNATFSNLDAPPPPAVLCAYTITPIFTFRRDQVLADRVDAIANVPATMATQLDGFMTTVSSAYGLELPETEVPDVTSSYTPGTTADVCDWAWMRFCYDL